MTKKDYQIIAQAIANTDKIMNRKTKELRMDFHALMVNLCKELKEENPNFDQVRFIDACLGTGERKCVICNKPEDEDGRCGCTNKDAY